MKKWMLLLLMCIFIFSLEACENEEIEPTFSELYNAYFDTKSSISVIISDIVTYDTTIKYTNSIRMKAIDNSFNDIYGDEVDMLFNLSSFEIEKISNQHYQYQTPYNELLEIYGSAFRVAMRDCLKLGERYRVFENYVINNSTIVIDVYFDENNQLDNVVYDLSDLFENYAYVINKTYYDPLYVGVKEFKLKRTIEFYNDIYEYDVIEEEEVVLDDEIDSFKDISHISTLILNDKLDVEYVRDKTFDPDLYYLDNKASGYYSVQLANANKLYVVIYDDKMNELINLGEVIRSENNTFELFLPQGKYFIEFYCAITSCGDDTIHIQSISQPENHILDLSKTLSQTKNISQSTQITLSEEHNEYDGYRISGNILQMRIECENKHVYFSSSSNIVIFTDEEYVYIYNFGYEDYMLYIKPPSFFIQDYKITFIVMTYWDGKTIDSDLEIL